MSRLACDVHTTVFLVSRVGTDDSLSISRALPRAVYPDHGLHLQPRR